MSEFTVTEAILYRMGVGWFSAVGTTDSNIIYFPVNDESIDDLLKTMMVTVKNSSAALKNISFETIGTQKKLFSSDMVMDGVIEFLRGKQVILVYQRVNEVETIQGKIMGYQEGDRKTIFSILTKKGVIRPFETNKIIELEPVDLKVKEQLDEFMNSLAIESDSTSQRICRIQLSEKGNHDVKISFLTKIPAWKLSYRIYVSENSSKFDIFGVVDNNTLVDWNDALLTLSTKIPVSFKYDLSTPHIIDRPSISRETSTGYSVPIVDESRNLFNSIAERSSSPKMYPSRKKSLAVQQQYNQQESLPSELLDSDSDYGEDDYEDEIDYQSTTQIGESVEYIINNPVTIKKNESSMIPLSSESIPTSNLNYYNKSNHKSHPFLVVEIHNNLGFAIDKGPISVLSTDKTPKLLGEGMINDLGIDDKYLLSYAINRNVAIEYKVETKSNYTGVSIQDYYRYTNYTDTKYHRFTVINKSEDQTRIYLSIPKDHFKPIEKQDLEVSTTTSELRVKAVIDGNTEKAFEYQTYYTHYNTKYLKDLTINELEKLISNKTISEEEKEELKKLHQFSLEIRELQKQFTLIKSKMVRTSQRRKQIIETLDVVGSNTDEEVVRKKYIAEIQDLDTKAQEYEVY
ncbi:MAG: hypothetical protein OEY49_13045 [Candidatus Heimdallarchaeota archaeon]|nr:hypothetical protein [Candidatus Heimdallarchaeota archaeon]